MSSTTKTTNYNLSQFADADKPTWRGDYNGDMLKIDNGITGACTQAQAAATLATDTKTSVQQLSAKVTGVETTANNALSLARTNEADISTNETAFNQYKTSIDTRLNQLTELVDTKLTAPPDGYQAGAHMEMHFTQASWTNTFTPNGSPIYIPFADPTGNAVGKWATKKSPGIVELKPGTYLFVGKTRIADIQSGQHSFSVGFELNTGGDWFSSKVLSAETFSFDLASSAPPAEGLISSVFGIGQTCQVRFGVKARGSGENFTAVIGESHVQVIRLNEGIGAARGFKLLHAIEDAMGTPDM